MSEFHVAVGDHTTFSKTVTESDVYLFAGITGDFAPNHVNKAFMEKSSYGRPIAHGALLVGFMSAAATHALDALRASPEEVPVSLGYDRVRFLAPVFFGDTVTVEYRISAIDGERRRASADIRVVNQDGTLVAVATQVLKWVTKEPGTQRT
jgi:3-hydroxybutyryl-CoA dehydratase